MAGALPKGEAGAGAPNGEVAFCPPIDPPSSPNAVPNEKASLGCCGEGEVLQGAAAGEARAGAGVRLVPKESGADWDVGGGGGREVVGDWAPWAIGGRLKMTEAALLAGRWTAYHLSRSSVGDSASSSPLVASVSPALTEDFLPLVNAGSTPPPPAGRG